ncbi:MAG: polynucleotide adenylyltransferase PcnB, partial [Spirochaetales bacterium]|nr:polynucleotide adenylyltransferase PcnB [Spirochaetales bacterium]
DKPHYGQQNGHPDFDQFHQWRESAHKPKLNIFQKLFGLQPKKLIPTVIDRDVHNIDKSAININALKVVRRLQEKGYDAYIVGGAVRDLLSHRIPKDFDVVTNATPHAVKKNFGNARIIGRRFKLVHIIFKDCIIETATFRAAADEDAEISPLQRNNIFGTIEDDCMRRDFSINALYYDPQKDVIVDYVGGYRDMLQHKLKVLREPNESFIDDPVRMIRALKYSSLVDCKMDKKTIKAIMTNHARLSSCPVARLHEEINKIFKTHKAHQIFRQCYETRILSDLVPFLSPQKMAEHGNELIAMLTKLDSFMTECREVPVEIYWAVLLFNAEGYTLSEKTTQAEWEVFKIQCHEMLAPLKVPNRIIERATDIIRLYVLMYNNANLTMLQKIKRMQLTYEVMAFAVAADCLPIQDLLKDQIKAASESKPKKKKRRRKPKKPPERIKTISLDEIPEEQHTPTGKKCIATHKKEE